MREESELIDAATAAYARARREVYDVGLTQASPQLNAEQREVLVELAAAEQELAEFRQRRR